VSDLTTEEQKNVRTAIRFLRARCGTWANVAKVLGVSEKTVRVRATPLVVFRVARFAKVGVDDVLSGRFPEPGTCPHCGHKQEEAAE
jgi:hypothetical protein